MEGEYGVFFGNQQLGRVSVRRQGLYYRFFCRCRLEGETMCRLQVVCGDIRENLGVLVPADGGFALDTRLPVKRLGTGKPEFRLVPKYEKSAGMFVPVYPEEPFAYISRLKDAYLERRNGQMGILLK